MMQPNESPANDSSLPQGWPRNRPTAKIIASTGLMGLFTVSALVGAGLAAASGQPGPAILFVLAAVYLGHFVGLGISLSRRPAQVRPLRVLGRTDLGDPGLEIPYAHGPYYWSISVTLLSALTLAGITVIFALSGSAGALVVAVISAIFSFVLGWIGVVFLRLAPGRLVLTPDGIYHRSLTFEHYVPWFAIYAVSAEAGATPMLAIKAHPFDGTRLHGYTGRLGAFEATFFPFIVARTYWLGGHAAYAYQIADHYFRHPDLRSELATSPPTFG
ncbi:MAG: hypothetical protein QOH97_956 [Actinoplanes sp.]|jgi:hypothetical protein|nr:hypothetical protein [Actinoplanes sp.]